MCRWIAYIGKDIFVDTLVTRPAYSLVEQSLHAKLSLQLDGSILATNGDGFGLGWYMDKGEPGLFKTAEPTWSNENINEICAQIKAKIFMAHVRAASTGSIQRTNSHPFNIKTGFSSINTPQSIMPYILKCAGTFCPFSTPVVHSTIYTKNT